ncbi:MAG TPA: hypothetical protein VF746_16585 [Longimicrobium sp.]
MLVVISDLHFEEEDHDVITDPATGRRIGRRRNFPVTAFLRWIRGLALEAARNGGGREGGGRGVRELHLVLAGDIFDVNRTTLWFTPPGGPMPYDDPPAAGSPLEAKVLQVLRAIAGDERVEPVLRAFRLLATQGRYVDDAGEEADFPADRIQVHYLPGNHDRLCNATPEIRRWVRETLGIAPVSGDRFANQLEFADPRVLVRHGHEYDRFNFSADLSKAKTIPARLPPEQYDAPPFGDFTTVQVGSRLPLEFRRVHGEERILATPLLEHVYERLLEFDDVRPQSAVVEFLLRDPDLADVPDREIWAVVEPVVRRILADVRRDPFLRGWLKRLEKQWEPDVFDAVQVVLDTSAWKLTRRLPLSLVRRLAGTGGGEGAPPVAFAAREEAIQGGRARYLVAGHTHRPAVELAAADRDGGRYYIDTGTWRNRIPTAPGRTGFGRVKALTYVILWSTGEDRGDPPHPGKIDSFDYWSGYTQRFPAA